MKKKKEKKKKIGWRFDESGMGQSASLGHQHCQKRECCSTKKEGGSEGERKKKSQKKVKIGSSLTEVAQRSHVMVHAFSPQSLILRCNVRTREAVRLLQEGRSAS